MATPTRQLLIIVSVCLLVISSCGEITFVIKSSDIHFLDWILMIEMRSTAVLLTRIGDYIVRLNVLDVVRHTWWKVTCNTDAVSVPRLVLTLAHPAHTLVLRLLVDVLVDLISNLGLGEV